jgi:hypothetical protein
MQKIMNVSEASLLDKISNILDEGNDSWIHR